MGKSRIIATIALLLLIENACKKVHILVPNEALKMRDSEEFE